MKSIQRNTLFIFLVLLIACQPQQPPVTPDKEAITKEVTDQFNQLISAINKLDVGAWSAFYSRDAFISSFVSTDFYASRSAFADSITYYFSMRERQRLEPAELQVTPLSAELALSTSSEKTEMLLKSGGNYTSKHVFTMIWKKEKDNWKIIHSHESWVVLQAN